MAKFNIIHCDPAPYKNEILAFWEKYLPDAPAGRFEWMAQGNPAGEAVWFLAFEKNSDKLAGTISIMPRMVTIRGKEYLAGIVGDLMVAKEHRVFGPNIQLLRSVIKEHKNIGFDFLYTIPNRDSEKLTSRAGFKTAGVIKRYVKPMDYEIILQRYTSGTIAKIISLPANFISRILSKEIYISSNLLCEEVRALKEDYELFSNELKDYFPAIGDRSKNYIQWRYLKNPLYEFNIDLFRRASDGSISGYVIYTAIDNGINVFDIIAKDESNFKGVFAHFLKKLKKTKIKSVSINAFQDNPLLPFISSFLFFERQDSVPLHYCADSMSLPDGWVFFSGDRNI